MLTNKEIWEIALRQSAVDYGCAPEDFLADRGKVTISRKNPEARKYLPLPFDLDMTSYGNCIVAQCREDLVPIAEEYMGKYDAGHAFETPCLQTLDEMLTPYHLKTCFMAEYFLPDVEALKSLPCDYELRVLLQPDFADLYRPEWSNALCENRTALDVLGVGAYDAGKLVGLAGCSADCEEMWQIGVDVLPEYRRKGVASAVTSRLTQEILAAGIVPFYCAAWCNLKSVRNAIKCGFRPAWVTVTARDTAFVKAMNRP